VKLLACLMSFPKLKPRGLLELDNELVNELNQKDYGIRVLYVD